MTGHSGRVWGKTLVQSVLKRYCQSTIMVGASVHVTSHGQTARFEKGIKILVDKKKHWVDFYHYRVVVYIHCQHTFKFKQLVKVHVALYDPFKDWVNCASVYVYTCERRKPWGEIKLWKAIWNAGYTQHKWPWKLKSKCSLKGSY